MHTFSKVFKHQYFFFVTVSIKYEKKALHVMQIYLGKLFLELIEPLLVMTISKLWEKCISYTQKAVCKSNIYFPLYSPFYDLCNNPSQNKLIFYSRKCNISLELKRGKKKDLKAMYGTTFSKATLLTINCFDCIRNIKLKFETECVFICYLKC